ncbi:hypothetical protein HDE_04313 [Halotydeus destructor]|nr:hypothetical protein HDE_04313 [Halotydeus destructor]
MSSWNIILFLLVLTITGIDCQSDQWHGARMIKVVMPISMTNEVTFVAEDAMNKHSDFSGRIHHIIDHMNKAYGGKWNVIMVKQKHYRDYEYGVSYATNRFLFFSMKGFEFTVYQSN